ncbi:MAG: type IV pilus assembly protein PilW [Halieaceae bacterium]|jgi:type IV pilus assembly protein PilW
MNSTPHTADRLYNPRHARGLSLIELMVALGIGAFLMLGIVTVFLANKNSAAIENSLAGLQENGRFAIDMIRRDLHRSQFLGCNTGQVFFVNMIDDPNEPGFNAALDGLRGYRRADDGSWGTVPDPNDLSAGLVAAEASRGARDGSDVLSVRMTESLNPDDPNDLLLTALVLPSSTAVSVDDNPDCRVQSGSRLVLSGCNLTAHLFEVTNAQTCAPATAPNATTFVFGASANTTTRINTTYNTESQILLYEAAFWFVADTQRVVSVNNTDVPVYALYREVNGERQEMIEGVEFMQVRFGQRVAGTDNLRFVAGDDANLNTGLNYEGVNSVHISFLLQAFDAVRTEDDDNTYSLLGTEYSLDTTVTHSGGRFQRDVFSAVISLRNAPDF